MGTSGLRIEGFAVRFSVRGFGVRVCLVPLSRAGDVAAAVSTQADSHPCSGPRSTRVLEQDLANSKTQTGT